MSISSLVTPVELKGVMDEEEPRTGLVLHCRALQYRNPGNPHTSSHESWRCKGTDSLERWIRRVYSSPIGLGHRNFASIWVSFFVFWHNAVSVPLKEQRKQHCAHTWCEAHPLRWSSHDRRQAPNARVTPRHRNFVLGDLVATS